MPVFNNILAGASGATGAAAFQIDRSLRFNSGDSAYLNRTPSTAGNRKTWTWSGWLKKCAEDTNAVLFSRSADSSNRYVLSLYQGNFYFYSTTSGSATLNVRTSGEFRDPSAWYHVVFAFDTTQATANDRTKIYINGVQQTLTYTTQPSQNADFAVNTAAEHRIGGDAGSSEWLNGYLTEVQFVDGSALAASDFGEYDANNVWQPKEYSGTYGTNGFYLKFDDNSSNSALGNDSSGNDNDWTVHNLIALDPGITTSAITTIGTSGSNTLLTFSDSTNFSQIQAGDVAKQVESTVNVGTIGVSASAGETSNLSSIFNSSASTDQYFESGSTSSPNKLNITTTVTLYPGQVFTAKIGMDNGTGNGATVSGAVGNVRIGGTDYQMTGSIVGNGTSNPCSYTGTLSFTVPDGGGGAWTQFFVTGLSSNDRTLVCEFAIDGVKLIHNQNIPSFTDYDVISVDSANSQLVVDPGATWSVGEILRVNSRALKDGDNLIDTPTHYTASSGNNNGGNYATFNAIDNTATLSNGNLVASGSGSGQLTARGTIGVTSGKYYFEYTVNALGGIGDQVHLGFGSIVDAPSGGFTVYLRQNGTANFTPSTGSLFSFAVSDIIGFAVDFTNSTFTCTKNGGSAMTGSFTSITDPHTFRLLTGDSGQIVVNAGQRPFAYTPPTGFLSLCTTNLPDPTIADGSTAMDVAVYTGDGTSNRAITGLGMSPDFVWIKSRSGTTSHVLLDAVRGTDKILVSDSTLAESTVGSSWQAQFGNLDSFDSAGFTVTNGTDAAGNFNSNNVTYAAWAWDAGSSTVSNTDGSITSQVRANASAGFSIVTYTGNGTAGATVGHGLGANVALYFAKNRTTANSWAVIGHALNDAFGGSQKYLNLDTTGAAGIASQGPGNSSTIELYSDASNNSNGDDFVAYCFAPVEGYSAFGSYVSNNDANGPFVYLGFQPKLIMWKNLDAAHGWYLYDDARDPDNPMSKYLAAHDSIAEGDPGGLMDVLSNGFKVRNTGADMNRDSHKILYMAWAEHPFKIARAR